jgi:dTDP-4-amino-4,6-dideoxygalactose transaminase
MNVPLMDIKAMHAPLVDEIAAAWRQILETAGFVGGERVAAFEAELAAFCGTKGAAAVRTGTDALWLALRAAGIGPGDEVITAPFTFIATTEAISLTGAKFRFVDIDPATFNLDPKAIEAAITKKTKAVLPVHLYGLPADMKAINAIATKRKLFVLEDAAQAIGASIGKVKAGGLGGAGAFSFYPTKNLSACGEGGAVASNDAELLARVRRLRDHGQSKKYEHSEEGWNARLDALQCAALSIKLKHLSGWNDARRRAAAWYDELLADVPGVTTQRAPAGFGHVYHLYVVRVRDRARVQAALGAAGIGTAVHYPIPLHKQPAYAGMNLGPFPNAERAAEEVLALPMWPGITREQVEQAAGELKKAVSKT